MHIFNAVQSCRLSSFWLQGWFWPFVSPCRCHTNHRWELGFEDLCRIQTIVKFYKILEAGDIESLREGQWWWSDKFSACRARVRIRIFPLQFQRLSVSCFQVAIWMKDYEGDIKSSKQPSPTGSLNLWLEAWTPCSSSQELNHHTQRCSCHDEEKSYWCLTVQLKGKRKRSDSDKNPHTNRKTP